MWVYQFFFVEISAVDQYLLLVHACANRDEAAIWRMSQQLGFVTGSESKIMRHSHVQVFLYYDSGTTSMIFICKNQLWTPQAAYAVGEPFQVPFYDFGASHIAHAVTEHAGVMLNERLTAPPTGMS